MSKPTIADLETTNLKDLPGKLRIGATKACRYKIVDCQDRYASQCIVSDINGSRIIVRNCDTGEWDQFMHRGF